jgi:hypothetical protein
MRTAYLPTHASPNMAAALTGLSSRAIRRMLRAGLLPSEGDTWQRIPLAALEQMLGRPITPETYLEADRRLDRARAKQATYNRTRTSPKAQDKDTLNRPISLRAGYTERRGPIPSSSDGSRSQQPA